MQQITRTMVRILVCILFLAPESYGEGIADYLITYDIGNFIASKNPTAGKGPGMLGGVGHFYHDHEDMTYEVSYFNLQTRLGPEVQVTQHAGSDSDKWLMHEMDAEFRNYHGNPDLSFVVKTIDGNIIYAFGSGGWDYRWLSGTKLIVIEYTDLEMSKPQPLEIVKAYLTKHPSTLSPIKLAELRSRENKTIWIKDEMERRLWLCDKWFLQVQLGKTELYGALKEILDHMFVFVDYREKYYGGINALNEKKLLIGYLDARDGTAIKNKLTTYKTWWSVNKTKSINLP